MPRAAALNPLVGANDEALGQRLRVGAHGPETGHDVGNPQGAGLGHDLDLDDGRIKVGREGEHRGPDVVDGVLPLAGHGDPNLGAGVELGDRSHDHVRIGARDGGSGTRAT